MMAFVITRTGNESTKLGLTFNPYLIIRNSDFFFELFLFFFPEYRQATEKIELNRKKLFLGLLFKKRI
jgi:hypothetical protein